MLLISGANTEVNTEIKTKSADYSAGKSSQTWNSANTRQNGSSIQSGAFDHHGNSLSNTNIHGTQCPLFIGVMQLVHCSCY